MTIDEVITNSKKVISQMLVEMVYNKAIDDFAKAIVDRGLSANDDKYCIIHYDNYLKVIREIAEQLKAGDNNGT